MLIEGKTYRLKKLPTYITGIEDEHIPEDRLVVITHTGGVGYFKADKTKDS